MLLLCFIILTILLFILIIWTYCKVSCGICKNSSHLVGKVVIVTGANSGIGFETAKDLAQRGARVILACRNLETGLNAKQRIINASANNDIHLREINLDSFNSIREFAKTILETEVRLDVLVNNAGCFSTDNRKTEDGLHTGMQANYFGPFLLTSLLLPLLKKSAPSRIINVTSFLYARGNVDFENLNLEKRQLSRHQVYSNAKLCTVLMTVELDRKLLGTGVTVNCLHPGSVNTNMTKNYEISAIRIALRILATFFKNPWEGAQTSIYLAVSSEVEKVSGGYFKDCHLSSLNSKAKNKDVAQKLWEVSEKIVGLR